ncbi:MAG: Ig-like domain-containing protein [Prevotella sp.]|nr:Ig-like domain-containing protein [Prevotella sp.]
MGAPDGGWYDEDPPYVVGASPADRSVNANTNKVVISFNEFVKIDNPTENVVVSPPQIELPEIKSAGKKIVVELKDTLKPNTTYTIDFSDAISDNNENNPLGNYTYSFSTGDHIDTMEVSGYVLEARNLEPVKGILVGLYGNLSDTVFRKEPLQRVARTDSRGHFVIKGIAHGSYRVYALKDADGDYMFSQKSEQIAFSHDIITPSSKPDVRPDTIWRDSLFIDSIVMVPYTHYYPDDIVLRAFREVQTNRSFIKAERVNPNRFSLFFTYGSEELPQIKGLNFNADDLVVEANLKKDSITYWLRDTALVNQDTLRFEMTYLATDSTGVLQSTTEEDMEVLAKESYEKRMKKKQKAIDDWNKKAEKAKKKGQDIGPYKEPVTPLKLDFSTRSELDPDKNIFITSPTPLDQMETTGIHLYSQVDSLWYETPFIVNPVEGKPRTFQVIGEWRPGLEYSLEIDSAAFVDIYGLANNADKAGFKVRDADEYSSLLMTISNMGGNKVVAQLLDKNDSTYKSVAVTNGVAEFFYILPGTYYMRCFIDENGNGVWDTGDYAANREAEKVYYYAKAIECKTKWDVTLTWNPLLINPSRQKPQEIIKQKADKEKTIKRRNYDRAKKLGIPTPSEMEKAAKKVSKKMKTEKKKKNKKNEESEIEDQPIDNQ